MIERIPENTKVEVKHHVCPYHKQNPEDRNYPACSCTSSYSLKVEDND